MARTLQEQIADSKTSRTIARPYAERIIAEAARKELTYKPLPSLQGACQ